MMEDEPELNLPAQYNYIPMRALRMESRQKVSSFLNLEGNLVVVRYKGTESVVVNNYSGLAELAGFNYQDIMNMKRQKSPTMELLDLWTTHQNGGTVGKLWMYLHMMERFDVLSECKRLILHECKTYEEQKQIQMEAERYNIEQDPTVSTSEMNVDETKYATVQDVLSGSGEKTFYDAFICYSAEDEKDRTFLFRMIDELEKIRGLKLFVPGRDDLPGSAEHTITAYVIEKRCRRVVILISRQFLKSAACDFQVKFAHALAPGARSKKLIPVVNERNTPIPSVLQFLAFCDFSTPDMVEWVWDRLYAAIIAPVGPVTYLEEEDSSDSLNVSGMKLQDIQYPFQRRLVENEDISNSSTVVQSGGRSETIDVFPSRERQPVECSVSPMSLGQPTSDNQTQNQAPVGSNSLPTEASAKSFQKRSFFQKMIWKQQKPVPTKKPDKSKGKKEKDSAFSITTSDSKQKEHFV